jgi:PAS domain S-box-containing protein
VDGSILYANPAACLALGYSEEELLGLSVPMITDLSPEELQDQ